MGGASFLLLWVCYSIDPVTSYQFILALGKLQGWEDFREKEQMERRGWVGPLGGKFSISKSMGRRTSGSTGG